MVQKKLVFVSGSPSERSRSARLLADVEQRVRARDVVTLSYSFRDFDASALLHADTEHAKIREFIEEVKSSDGIVVATPVYKATFAGALKVVLDLVPPDGLTGKVAFGIATARIASHLEPTGRALAGIFEFFKVRESLASALFVDDAVFSDATAHYLSRDTTELLDRRSDALLAALTTS